MIVTCPEQAENDDIKNLDHDWKICFKMQTLVPLLYAISHNTKVGSSHTSEVIYNSKCSYLLNTSKIID